MSSDAMGEWRRPDGDAPPGPGADPDLVCCHVSDLHGQLTPAHGMHFDAGEGRIVRGGGVPPMAASLDAIRSDADRSLTLMSGDTFHGTAVTTYTAGRAMIEPVNVHIRPDVYVPGNWDFHPEAAESGSFRTLMDALDAPVVAANLYDWTSGEPIYASSRLFDLGSHTIGVVGMTNPYVDRMAPAFHEGRYRFGKHATILAEAAAAARDAGADVVLAVTEIGLPWAVQAAKDVETIDVHFSAHTHEYTDEPIVVRDTDTVVVESGRGDALGRIDLRIDGDGIAVRHHLHRLDAEEIRPDPDARETVERIRAPFLGDGVRHERGAGTLDRSLDASLGTTDRPLHRHALLESGWNTLFNDAVRDHFDADLGLSHGFRYGSAVPAGPITLEDVYRCFPMTAPVARGVAYGQQLRSHVEDYLTDTFSPYPYQQEDGRVRSVSSNAELEIDPTAKRGRRLVDFRVDGDPVEDDATYDVATIRRPGDPDRDLGGCGFPFRDVEVDADTIPADVIAAYLEDHSPIDEPIGTRVRIAEDGGDCQNTPADGPYPYVQPGVDYADGAAYTETRLVPTRNRFPAGGRNRRR